MTDQHTLAESLLDYWACSENGASLSLEGALKFQQAWHGTSMKRDKRNPLGSSRHAGVRTDDKGHCRLGPRCHRSRGLVLTRFPCPFCYTCHYLSKWHTCKTAERRALGAVAHYIDVRLATPGPKNTSRNRSTSITLDSLYCFNLSSMQLSCVVCRRHSCSRPSADYEEQISLLPLCEWHT